MNKFLNNIYFKRAGGAGGGEEAGEPTQESDQESRDKIENNTEEATGASWWEKAKSTVGLEGEDYYEGLEEQIKAGEDVENETAEQFVDDAENKAQENLQQVNDEVDESIKYLEEKGYDASDLENLRDSVDDTKDEFEDEFDGVSGETVVESGESPAPEDDSQEMGSNTEGGKNTEQTSEQNETSEVDIDDELKRLSTLYENKQDAEDRLEELAERVNEDELDTESPQYKAIKQEVQKVNGQIDQVVENLQENTELSDQEIFDKFEEVHSGSEETEVGAEEKVDIKETTNELREVENGLEDQPEYYQNLVENSLNKLEGLDNPEDIENLNEADQALVLSYLSESLTENMNPEEFDDEVVKENLQKQQDRSEKRETIFDELSQELYSDEFMDKLSFESIDEFQDSVNQLDNLDNLVSGSDIAIGDVESFQSGLESFAEGTGDVENMVSHIDDVIEMINTDDKYRCR